MTSQMKKSRQSKNSGIILNLSKNNTKAKIDSFGDVELKYVSYGDTREMAKFLTQKISDRDFVLKVLFHQLIKPEIKPSKFKKLSDKELKKLGRAFVKKEDYTFKHFQDTGSFLKDFRQAIQTQNEKHIEELKKTFEPIVKSTQATIATFIKNNNQLFQTIQRLTESTSSIATKIFENFKSTTKWLEELDKAGLTPNLGDDRSHHKLKQYLRLLKGGYAIFWIPRADVIEKLLNATKESDRKSAILANKSEILDDCENVLNKISSKNLQDTKDHLKSSVSAFRQKNYRAAQSASAVGLDTQLDQIIDITRLNHYSRVMPTVNNKTKQLISTINNVPIHLIFAALQANLISAIFKEFDRTKPRTVRSKYNRHSSIHSVSKKQYSELNAILAIMIATSLLATTEHLGQGWFSKM